MMQLAFEVRLLIMVTKDAFCIVQLLREREPYAAHTVPRNGEDNRSFHNRIRSRRIASAAAALGHVNSPGGPARR